MSLENLPHTAVLEIASHLARGLLDDGARVALLSASMEVHRMFAEALHDALDPGCTEAFARMHRTYVELADAAVTSDDGCTMSKRAARTLRDAALNEDERLATLADVALLRVAAAREAAAIVLLAVAKKPTTLRCAVRPCVRKLVQMRRSQASVTLAWAIEQGVRSDVIRALVSSSSPNTRTFLVADLKATSWRLHPDKRQSVADFYDAEKSLPDPDARFRELANQKFQARLEEYRRSQATRVLASLGIAEADIARARIDRGAIERYARGTGDMRAVRRLAPITRRALRRQAERALLLDAELAAAGMETWAEEQSRESLACLKPMLDAFVFHGSFEVRDVRAAISKGSTL